jgi:hypothetical protein
LDTLNELDELDPAYEEIQNSQSLDIVLIPPTDGNESDVDDGPEDDERPTTIRDVGRGVLRELAEVHGIYEDGQRELNLFSEENKENQLLHTKLARISTSVPT